LKGVYGRVGSLMQSRRGWLKVVVRTRNRAERRMRVALTRHQRGQHDDRGEEPAHGGRSLDWGRPIAPVAHRTERSAPDRKAAGSIPARRTKNTAGNELETKTTQRARVNGIEIGYQITGKGEPLVLLHGGFGSV